MWVKEDGFTEREEHRGRRRGPEGTAGLESRLFQRLRQDQNRLRKNSLFVIPNGVCGVRNLLFPWHFAKEIPRFARDDNELWFFRSL
jgi:hypothetical protein